MFVVENNLPTEKTRELMQLFNDSLVEIGEFIINNATDKKNKVKPTHVVTNQKWASKVAQAFAEEKELTLDDFPGVEKVTKAHMLEYIKNQPTTKTKKLRAPPLVTKPTEDHSPANSSSTPKVGKGKKVTCAGITDKGDVCTRTGTITPDGSKKCYCFRHADKWRDFEEVISSDSDNELDLEVPPKSKNTINQDDSEEEPEPEPSSPISQKSSIKEDSEEEELVLDD